MRKYTDAMSVSLTSLSAHETYLTCYAVHYSVFVVAARFKLHKINSTAENGTVIN